MRLRAGNRKKYGIPYQGSKTRVIEDIARFFPNADHFYDLFGGGFSVTHYMLEHRKKSYKNFHFNEIRPGVCELIKHAIQGKYNYDMFKPEWISRERFLAEKESNAYIKIIWSFGNNGEGYLFGKDIESQKRSMHQAVVFDEFDNFVKETFGIDKWPNSLSITGKRLYLKVRLRDKGRVDIQRLQQLQQLQQLERLQQLQQLQQLERLQQLQQLQQLERLEQLERLQQLERLERLEFTSVDYRDVEIEKSAVIYCDIPYAGTADYGDTFNHKEFFDWASDKECPVFVSEYEIKDDRFFLLKEIVHRSTFSSGGKKNIPVIEKLYGNEAAYEIISKSLKQRKEAVLTI